MTMEINRDRKYDEIIWQHQGLAKRLCCPNSSSWNDFFEEIDKNPYEPKSNKRSGWLSSLYKKRLIEECNSCIEDFYIFLYEYLTRENNYILNSFIEKKTHFFSGYFRDILKGAYKEFKASHYDRFKKIPIDDDDSEINHKTVAATETMSPAIKRGFNSIRKFLWTKNQTDCLTVLLRHVFHQDNEYSRRVLGLDKANTVSARLRNLQKKKFFSADGTTVSDKLEAWLRHNIILTFTPDPKVLIPWEARIFLPYDCESPEITWCRIECLVNDNTPLDSGTLSWGSIQATVKDGCTEVRLKDIHAEIKHDRGFFSLLMDGQGESEGYPFIKEKVQPKIIDDDLLEPWKDVVHSPNREGVFISFFGTGLAYLFNVELDFRRYGAPAEIAYRHLHPIPGEAWTLFAAVEKFGSNGFLPKNGFIFPLEWRFHPEYENPHSNLLPQSILDLGKKIVSQFNASGWGLYPAQRFFHDSIDFSSLTLCCGQADAVSSAWLSLATALVMAMNRWYNSPIPVFASLQYDFAKEESAPVGFLEQKLRIANAWGAENFFVGHQQLHKEIQAHLRTLCKLHIVQLQEKPPLEIAQEAAYYFLKELKPNCVSVLKNVYDETYKIKRAELVKNLSSMVNASWDKKEEKSICSKIGKGSFIVLSGNPGMGKSLLLHDLAERWQNHTVISYVCQAGKYDSCLDFIRNISYQLALNSGAFAEFVLQSMHNLHFPEEALTREQAENLYEHLVFQPLIHTVKKNLSLRHYIVVDGLDEDDSGLIAGLLSNRKFRFPQNYAIIVSTRPIEPLLSTLKSSATGEMNLSDKRYADSCNKDLEKFIINLIYGNDAIRKCWENASVTLDDDKLREKISRKDRSFLYATYVLQGIEDGLYHFDRLDQELPAGLVDFYDKSFRYRFTNGNEYDKVKPLLELLLKEQKISLYSAQDRLNGKCIKYPIGKMIQALRGYCVVENNEIFLSDASLRDWLRDSVRNPDFSII